MPELQKTFSWAALAEQIAIELSKHHKAYQEAYRREALVSAVIGKLFPRVQ